jgi:hypothetical protein
LVAHSLEAEVAGIAGQAGIDRDPLSDPDPDHRIAYLLHFPRYLVSENKRFPDREIADPAFVEVVQVRTADATHAGTDANFVRAQGIICLGLLDDAKIAGAE